MDRNIVNLEKFKHDKYVEEQLAKLGLDEETVKEYDKEHFYDDIRDILKEFFIRREKISNELDDWIRSRCETMTDMTIFLSIITEHLQNLIVPDREYFLNLIFSSPKERKLEFEHWINVQSELEKLHLSSMVTYVEEMVNKK